MARERTGSVRIGPVSILTLVVALCLAVLAVLSVATANANRARAERQALFTADDYANEIAAQTLTADLSDLVAERRGTGETVSQGDVDRLIEAACAAAADEGTADSTPTGAAVLDAGATGDGAGPVATVTASFETPRKRRLDITLEITASQEVRITSWKTSTTWTEDTTDTLWTGA